MYNFLKIFFITFFFSALQAKSENTILSESEATKILYELSMNANKIKDFKYIPFFKILTYAGVKPLKKDEKQEHHLIYGIKALIRSCHQWINGNHEINPYHVMKVFGYGFPTYKIQAYRTEDDIQKLYTLAIKQKNQDYRRMLLDAIIFLSPKDIKIQRDVLYLFFHSFFDYSFLDDKKAIAFLNKQIDIAINNKLENENFIAKHRKHLVGIAENGKLSPQDLSRQFLEHILYLFKHANPRKARDLHQLEYATFLLYYLHPNSSEINTKLAEFLNINYKKIIGKKLDYSRLQALAARALLFGPTDNKTIRMVKNSKNKIWRIKNHYGINIQTISKLDILKQSALKSPLAFKLIKRDFLRGNKQQVDAAYFALKDLFQYLGRDHHFSPKLLAKMALYSKIMQGSCDDLLKEYLPKS